VEPLNQLIEVKVPDMISVTTLGRVLSAMIDPRPDHQLMMDFLMPVAVNTARRTTKGSRGLRVGSGNMEGTERLRQVGLCSVSKSIV
jgi:hypothetical protein